MTGSMRRLSALVFGLILTAALVGVACYFFTPVQITFKDTLANIAASFYLAMTLLPTWAIGSIIVLGVVWVLGLGLAFWPRFSMMRLYYHRLIMRDIRDVNKKTTNYKAIKSLELKDGPFIKTTTQKIKRFAEIKEGKILEIEEE